MIITQTPLRISLLGGNTDFREYYCEYGGFVVTTTINKYVYCIVVGRLDDLIVVNYSEREIVERVDDLKHELVREALKMVGITKGIEITFISDIPSKGSGLGSSSAVTVGTLNALHTYLGESVGSVQLAEEAVEIEVDILKKPIGVQDQYAVALGGLRWIEMEDKIIFGTRLDILDSTRQDFENSLMLFYTGITRESKSVLSSFNVKKNIQSLHHVKEMARLGLAFLEKNNIYYFGDLLDKYWKIKRSSNIKTTNSQIDKMYNRAKKFGAIGGKIIGAGGGGFMLLMVPENKRTAVRTALKDYRELPFKFENGGSNVILNIKKYL